MPTSAVGCSIRLSLNFGRLGTGYGICIDHSPNEEVVHCKLSTQPTMNGRGVLQGKRAPTDDALSVAARARTSSVVAFKHRARPPVAWFRACNGQLLRSTYHHADRAVPPNWMQDPCVPQARLIHRDNRSTTTRIRPGLLTHTPKHSAFMSLHYCCTTRLCFALEKTENLSELLACRKAPSFELKT